MGYKWKRVRLSLKSKRDQEEFDLKKEQIESLKKLEDNGYIDLYFGDESHFGLTPVIPYAWQDKEDPILLPASKGKYLNVVGFMTRRNALFYEILETTLNTDGFIAIMDRFVKQINKKTVVILDNCPIHKSRKFIHKMKQWEEQDLLIFFLPPYSPELNIIEILWKRIKYQWIPFNAYTSFQNLKTELSLVLADFGRNKTLYLN